METSLGTPEEDDDISRKEGPQTPMTPFDQQQLLADAPHLKQDAMLYIEE